MVSIIAKQNDSFAVASMFCIHFRAREKYETICPGAKKVTKNHEPRKKAAAAAPAAAGEGKERREKNKLDPAPIDP